MDHAPRIAETHCETAVTRQYSSATDNGKMRHMAEDTPSAELLGLTAEIVAAHVSNNPVALTDLPNLITEVYRTLSSVGLPASKPQPERPQPAVPIKKSITPEYLICLEDGKKLKMLKRHLQTSYNMTPEQYRERWGLGIRLSYGRAELRQASLVAGEEDRARHQAARSPGAGHPA